MGELKRIRAWLDTLDFLFSDWNSSEESEREDEQIEWLEARDEPAFEAQWNRVLLAIQAHEASAPPLEEAEETLLEEIRRIAFLKMMRSPDLYFRDSEMAACVSDDFQLLARAVRVGYSDPFLVALRGEYEAGRFPRGAL